MRIYGGVIQSLWNQAKRSYRLWKRGDKWGAIIELMPAPKGTGLLVEQECQKLLRFAGIKDVRSKQKRSTKTKLNLIVACFNALKKLMEVKIKQEHVDRIGVVEGMVVKK